MNSQWEMSADISFHQGYSKLRGIRSSSPQTRLYLDKVKDTKIIGAIHQAVFESNTAMPIHCPSGDCAWEPYKSLGICNSCADVTAATNITRVCEDGPGTSWDETKMLNRTCQYETPSGYQIGGNAVNWYYMRDYEQYHTLWNSTTYWDDFRHGEHESPPDQGLATVAALKFVEYDDVRVASPEIWLESAHECTFSWCVIEYSSTNAKNGQLSDEATHSVPLTRLDSAPCHNESAEYSDRISGSAWSSTGIVATRYLVPGFEPDKVPETLPCYTINGAAYEHFSTNPKAFWLNPQDDENLRKALDSILTTTFESIARPGDDKARALFRAASFPDTMDQVARSMTIQIRTGPNQTEIHGSVQINDQYIHVRLVWMILPASLVLLSAAFLVTSMTMATRDCNGWKSSVLPGFYHGLSGWDAKELHTCDIEDMERSAKGMWVKLGDDEDGSAKLMRAKKSSD
jgi:hypothetical protein